MATLTIHVPEDLKRDLEETTLLGWEQVVIDALQERVSKLKILNAIAAKSKLTEKDALELGKKIKKGMHKRFMKEHPEAY